MTLTVHRRIPAQQISPRILTRLRRILLTVTFIAAAIVAGLLGIVLAPYLGKILLTALAVLLLWMLVVSVVDFFQS